MCNICCQYYLHKSGNNINDTLYRKKERKKDIRMRAGMLVHDCLGSRTDAMEHLIRDDE